MWYWAFLHEPYLTSLCLFHQAHDINREIEIMLRHFPPIHLWCSGILFHPVHPNHSFRYICGWVHGVFISIWFEQHIKIFLPQEIHPLQTTPVNLPVQLHYFFQDHWVILCWTYTRHAPQQLSGQLSHLILIHSLFLWQLTGNMFLWISVQEIW